MGPGPRIRTWALLAVVVLAAAAIAGLALTAALTTARAPAAPTRPVAAVVTSPPQPSPATAVGAIFDVDPEGLGDHYCTGAVIDSSHGDVVLTAAHCVAAGDGTPARTDVAFVPGYHDGDAPFGVWRVTGTVLDPRWTDDADPDVDVAFLTVAGDGPASLQSRTGGFRVAIDPGAGDVVRAIGYPSGSDDLVEPTGTTRRFSPTQLELDGPTLPAGTSGGPWLRGTQIVGSPVDTRQAGTPSRSPTPAISPPRSPHCGAAGEPRSPVVGKRGQPSRRSPEPTTTAREVCPDLGTQGVARVRTSRSARASLK